MSDSPAIPSPLFLQLLVFTDCSEIKPLLLPLEHLAVDVVIYRDLNDPQGIAVLALVDDPRQLVADLRATLDSRVFRVLMQRHDLTMTGRTWSGADLSLEQAKGIVTDSECPWAVWYSMKTTPAFGALDESAQAAVLDELGNSGGSHAPPQGQIHLKSHGLDRGGNTLMLGAHAASLGELSRFIEAVKSGAPYAQHVAAAGPFFVGHAIRRGEGSAAGARW